MLIHHGGKCVCLQFEQDARDGRCRWKREEGGLGREDEGGRYVVEGLAESSSEPTEWSGASGGDRGRSYDRRLSPIRVDKEGTSVRLGTGSHGQEPLVHGYGATEKRRLALREIRN